MEERKIGRKKEEKIIIWIEKELYKLMERKPDLCYVKWI